MKLSIILLLFLSLISIAAKTEENINPELNREFGQLNRMVWRPSFLEILERLEELSELLGFHPVCSTCTWVLDILYYIFTSKPVFWIIDILGDTICPIFEPFPLCSVGARRFAPIYIINTIRKLTFGSFICPYLKLCSNQKIVPQTKEQFRDKVLADKPPRKRPKLPSPGVKTLKLLIFTDTHLDPDYEEGKSGTCGYPICCRKGVDEAKDPSDRAGKFGFMGNCDLPVITLDDFLDIELEKQKPDLIAWLGDNNGHNLWEQEKSNHLDSSLYIAKKLKEKYPNIGNVYPVIGNHEALPVDNYDVWGHSSDWIQQGLGEAFKQWLTPESYESFVSNGWFSQKHPGHNLRIITLVPWPYQGLNTYSWRNATDIWGSLEWLHGELLKAERAKENVIILGHTPPSSGCSNREWGYRFRVIVDRFTNIIRGMTFGHTHEDTWQLINSFSDPEPAGVVQILPPLGTYRFLNPAYRIYSLSLEDPSPSYTFLDQTTYRLYLEQANYLRTPLWKVAYSFTDKYAVESMEPEQFLPITERIGSNYTFYADVLYYLYGEGPKGAAFEKEEYGQLFWYCYFRHGSFWEMDACVDNHYPILKYRSYKLINKYVLNNWYHLEITDQL